MTHITNSTPSPAEKSLTRRNFIELAWKGLLGVCTAIGLGGVARFLSFQPYPAPQTRFDLGPAQELDLSKAIIIEEAQAVLIPSGNKLLAFSLVCTHLGCTVELTTDRFSCPCHGSQFNLAGELLKGPAAQPLRQLNLEVDDNGHLILDIAISDG